MVSTLLSTRTVKMKLASNWLTFAAYNEREQTLQVGIKSNKEGEPDKLYLYQGVPLDAYLGLLKASMFEESAGKHFNQEIKPHYPCTKLVS